jgi:hypothetical protein
MWLLIENFLREFRKFPKNCFAIVPRVYFPRDVRKVFFKFPGHLWKIETLLVSFARNEGTKKSEKLFAT